MKRLLSIFLVLATLLSFSACVNGGGDGSETDTKTEAVYRELVTDGESAFEIVMSESATDSVKTLAKSISEKVERLTGVKLARKTDNTQKYPETQYEILIGISGREATVSCLDGLGVTGYKMEFVGDKLVIVASNDAMLEAAVDDLFEKYTTVDGSTLKIDSALSVTYDGSADMCSLVDADGNFQYQIIYPDANTNGERELASDIRSAIAKALDCKVGVAKSDVCAESEYELLIGETSREESAELYGGIDVITMTSCIMGKKIVIGAGMTDKLSIAVTDFISNINSMVKGTYKGEYLLMSDHKFEKCVYEWMESVPRLAEGELIGTDDVGDGSLVMVYEKVSDGARSEYLSLLSSLGYAKMDEYSIAENKYVRLSGAVADIYVSYVAATEEMRVFAEKTGATSYPSSEQTAYTTVDGYKPTMWQMYVDVRTTATNGGMSYVMKVADGSFVIIDGGYNSETEADNLYNHLKANTADEVPVISAWIITHPHGDHFGALQAFTPKYKDAVTVKAFYYNFAAEGYGESSWENTISSLMKQYKGAAIYRKLHTGMTFYVADARFDVLFTHEDIYPVKGAVVNDTSTVLRMTFGGKTVMFLGDIMESASRVVEKNIPASELKADFVQYSHHGYEGATRELYDMIEAPVVLWPVTIYGWQRPDPSNLFERLIALTGSKLQDMPNKYIVNEAEYVEKIIVMGEGTTEIILSEYEPKGDKLPDYKAIHDMYAAEEAQNAG